MKYNEKPLLPEKSEMSFKVLLTGFAPFGGDETNTSWEAVKRVVCPEAKLSKQMLPVEWGTAAKTLFRAWDAFSPDAVLMVGLAKGSEALRIERVAVNICGAIKDSAGKYPDGSFTDMRETNVRDGAPAAYFATYNHSAVLDFLKAGNIPAAYSYSAGTYICNYVMFSALDRAARENPHTQIGFIHVPQVPLRQRGLPQEELSVITRGLELAVRHISLGGSVI